jgi:hypothetical protein
MRSSVVRHNRIEPVKTGFFRANPFMAGLAMGLVSAAIIALYITQSPVPFVDRVGTRPVEKSRAPGDRTGAEESVDPNRGLLAKDAGETESLGEAGIDPKTVSPSGLTYLLQVGTFRAMEDAEQMRARMAILGFEARITDIEKDGAVLHRVRMGPYGSIEELNKSKARVLENGIDSIVIRVNVR